MVVKIKKNVQMITVSQLNRNVSIESKSVSESLWVTKHFPPFNVSLPGGMWQDYRCFIVTSMESTRTNYIFWF